MFLTTSPVCVGEENLNNESFLGEHFHWYVCARTPRSLTCTYMCESANEQLSRFLTRDCTAVDTILSDAKML